MLLPYITVCKDLFGIFSGEMASQGTRFVGGHTQIVLSVAVSNLPNVRIISGAESGELAVWTVDGTNVHKSCIGEGDVTSLACSTSRPDIFYAACGDTISCFDLRQLTGPVSQLDSVDEEINQIALNEKENFLASADDSGNIKVFNLSSSKLYKTLRKHTNICAAVSFRPNRPWELVSGAYDSSLIQWDFAKSRSFCIIRLEELGAVPENLESYVVSPSFVHSIAVSSTGNRLACGTENALVQIFDSSKKTLHFQKTLRHHTQGVSQVHFPKFDEDKYLVSGGNDGRICVWNLEEELSHGVALTNGCSVAAGNNSVHQTAHNPAIEINHTEKINWLASGAVNNNKFLAVADNTSCPVIFQFPL